MALSPNYNLIDWLKGASFNGGARLFLMFPWRPSRAYSTVEIQWNGWYCQWWYYWHVMPMVSQYHPWHGAPFEVPSDGHTFSSHSRIFHSYGDVTISGEGLQILIRTRHSWPLSSEGSLASHTYGDTVHPFIMFIYEDPWHSHLLPSSCHYLSFE